MQSQLPAQTHTHTHTPSTTIATNSFTYNSDRPLPPTPNADTLDLLVHTIPSLHSTTSSAAWRHPHEASANSPAPLEIYSPKVTTADKLLAKRYQPMQLDWHHVRCHSPWPPNALGCHQDFSTKCRHPRPAR